MTRTTPNIRTRLKKWRWKVTVKRWPIHRSGNRRGGGEALANNQFVRATGATFTVRRPAAAGFSPVADAGRQHDGSRDNADPFGLATRWVAWAWPLNRRILHITALRRSAGNPDPKRQLPKWKAENGPDGIFRIQSPRRAATDRLSCSRKGWSPVCHRCDGEGPFPEHYEPFETPLLLTRCTRTLSSTLPPGL